jgi:hypothetical protein
MAYPCISLFEAMDNDPTRETLGNLQESWYAIFKSEPKMIREVRGFLNTSNAEDLLEILNQIAGNRDGIDNQKLGWWLKKHAGRIVNGRRFEKDTTMSSNSDRWEVVTV